MPHNIDYQIIRHSRRKRATIIILPNGTVEVRAPQQMPVNLIERFVDEKASWISDKLQQQRDNDSRFEPKSFTDGEQFRFLGEDYILSLQPGKRQVSVVADRLQVTLNRQEPTIIGRMITAWYREQAENHFRQRCLHFSRLIGKTPALVAVKNYKSRWGSCHHDGRIYFNWRLIMAPPWVIDYVVVHELTHLIHHNHSKQYWQRVEAVDPAFRKAKQWLKLHGHMLAL